MARCEGAVPQWTTSGAAAVSAVVDGSNLSERRNYLVCYFSASWIPFRLLGTLLETFKLLESQTSLLPWSAQHLPLEEYLHALSTTHPTYEPAPHSSSYFHFVWPSLRSRARLPRQPRSYASLMYSVLFVQDSVASSHPLDYTVVRYLISLDVHGGSRSSAASFPLPSSTSLAHSRNLYFGVPKIPPTFLDHYSTSSSPS